MKSEEPAVRILPMDNNEDEFQGQSPKQVQRTFFLRTLASNGGRYEFKSQGLDATSGETVLFQYESSIVASATFDRCDKAAKTIYFDSESIRVFKPLDADSMRKAWPAFRGFSNVKQSLSLDGYSEFERKLEQIDPEETELDGAPIEPLRLTTAQSTQPIHGTKLYQKQAREALPLLVRQAEAGTSIFYSDLAKELAIANPRHLNRVLGSIGQSLEQLSVVWGEKVPPIQCLVISKKNEIPGEGIGWFLLKKDDFAALPIRQRREIVRAELQRIFTYRRWRDVLLALGLERTETDFSDTISAASKSFGNGGESDQHRALKDFVANNPNVVGLGYGSKIGETESPLPSGDCLDVSFVRKNLWVAAEVKSLVSNEADITRGLFQCVKYLAVMEAALAAMGKPQNVRVFLVLEGRLTPRLVSLKNLLGVEVLEGIEP